MRSEAAVFERPGRRLTGTCELHAWSYGESYLPGLRLFGMAAHKSPPISGALRVATPYVRPEARRLTLAAVCSRLEVACQLLAPWPLALAVDHYAARSARVGTSETRATCRKQSVSASIGPQSPCRLNYLVTVFRPSRPFHIPLRRQGRNASGVPIQGQRGIDEPFRQRRGPGGSPNRIRSSSLARRRGVRARPAGGPAWTSSGQRPLCSPLAASGAVPHPVRRPRSGRQEFRMTTSAPHRSLAERRPAEHPSGSTSPRRLSAEPLRRRTPWLS
jgi:hypothetical protein